MKLRILFASDEDGLRHQCGSTTQLHLLFNPTGTFAREPAELQAIAKSSVLVRPVNPNMHHLSLIWGELMGKGKIEMVGFPVLGGGQPVMLEGCTGVIYKQSPEAEAFRRWQEGNFLEIERGYAKSRR